MNEMLDSLPHKIFTKLKLKYPVKTIVIRQGDTVLQGVHLAFKDHRAYIAHKFSQMGVEVQRFAHDYNSLDTKEPKMGLVYLANDSVIDPGLEVHCLIGHNSKYMDKINEVIV